MLIIPALGRLKQEDGGQGQPGLQREFWVTYEDTVSVNKSKTKTCKVFRNVSKSW